MDVLYGVNSSNKNIIYFDGRCIFCPSCPELLGTFVLGNVFACNMKVFLSSSHHRTGPGVLQPLPVKIGPIGSDRYAVSFFVARAFQLFSKRS